MDRVYLHLSLFPAPHPIPTPRPCIRNPYHYAILAPFYSTSCTLHTVPTERGLRRQHPVIGPSMPCDVFFISRVSGTLVVLAWSFLFLYIVVLALTLPLLFLVVRMYMVRSLPSPLHFHLYSTFKIHISHFHTSTHLPHAHILFILYYQPIIRAADCPPNISALANVIHTNHLCILALT